MNNGKRFAGRGLSNHRNRALYDALTTQEIHDGLRN